MTRRYHARRASLARLIATFAFTAICAVSAVADSTSSQTAAPDGKSYDLRYKFRTGDVLRYEIQHRASIRSTIEEVTQSAQTSTDSTKSWKVTDVLPSGEIEFMTVVERVHMINQLPDRAATEYNSEQDKTPPPGFDDAAKAIGVPLSVVRMTPQGKVVERKVKHRQAGTEDDGALVIRLPETPVAIGATWDEPLEVTVQLESGGTKSIQTRRHYKLKNVSNGLATIEVTYQVLSPVNPHIESQLVQRLMSGEVKFDLERGRLVSQRMDVDKRILGFAGATSSMQYVMRMEERLIEPEPKAQATKTAEPPKATAAKTTNSKAAKTSPQKRSNATATAKSPSGTRQSAQRSRPNSQSKSQRR